ncbi:MAG TPA: putative Ig domain-containing protein [Candidatus Angelobacter sp.]|nr:putative Ig domain-containing protein [Candidatus Angelobacter sp.]
MLRDLNRKSLASFFLALSIIGLVFVLPTSVSAAPTGTHFDHIVIIAMENTPYNSIIGGGSDPFINSMLPGAAALDMNSYSSIPSISGCSAGCYTAFTSANTYGVSDGVSSGSVSQTNLFDRLTGAGLTWQGYCENGCPRSGDHYPCLQYSDTYQSSNCATLSGPLVGDSQVLSTFNSASPPNYIWLTPDDTDNMHSSSVSTGDSWLHSFLVGSGSLTSPASSSLLSTSLFTSSSYHTLLVIWWDECSSSCSSGPFGANDKAEIYYGSMVSNGLVDKTTQWTDYNALRTIEDNWGLTCLSNECNPTTGVTGLFGAGVPPQQTPDFSIAASPVSMTVQVGGSGSASIRLSSISGLSGAASLTATGDSGLSVSLSQASLSLSSGGSGSDTLTVTVLSSASAGPHSAKITATLGSLQHSITLTVQVTTTPPTTQLAGNFGSPPWTLNAHAGGLLPTITGGVLDTTTVNPSSTSYVGTYDSNVFIGSEDWCGCVPRPLNYTTFSINGTFTGLSVSNPSNHDYTIENSFYFYLPSGVSGTNCGSSVTNAHWLDVEVFYSGRPSSPSSYIGCASAGDINYREVENSLQPGQSFQLNGFSITGVYQRALSMQALPTNTNGYLASIEVGTEGYGINYVTADWYVVTVTGSGSFPVNYILSLAVPGLVNATPGSKIVFIVNATDLGVGRRVALSATGVPSAASFDQATGRFSWGPTSSEMGTYNVTFTATDDGSPPKSSSKSVLIKVQQASQPTPGPGVCLQCLLTPTALTSLWLVTIAGLVGMTGMIGAFYAKTRARLAAAKRMKRLAGVKRMKRLNMKTYSRNSY